MRYSYWGVCDGLRCQHTYSMVWSQKISHQNSSNSSIKSWMSPINTIIELSTNAVRFQHTLISLVNLIFYLNNHLFVCRRYAHFPFHSWVFPVFVSFCLRYRNFFACLDFINFTDWLFCINVSSHIIIYYTSVCIRLFVLYACKLNHAFFLKPIQSDHLMKSNLFRNDFFFFFEEKKHNKMYRAIQLLTLQQQTEWSEREKPTNQTKKKTNE